MLLLLERQEDRPANLPQITLERIEPLGSAGFLFRLIDSARPFSVIGVVAGLPSRFTHRKTPAAWLAHAKSPSASPRPAPHESGGVSTRY